MCLTVTVQTAQISDAESWETASLCRKVTSFALHEVTKQRAAVWFVTGVRKRIQHDRQTDRQTVSVLADSSWDSCTKSTKYWWHGQPYHRASVSYISAYVISPNVGCTSWYNSKSYYTNEMTHIQQEYSMEQRLGKCSQLQGRHWKNTLQTLKLIPLKLTKRGSVFVTALSCGLRKDVSSQWTVQLSTHVWSLR